MSHASGLPTRAEDLGAGYDDDLLFWALRNCLLLRERISIVDLADLLGVWSDETARSIVADSERPGMTEVEGGLMAHFVFMLTHGDRTVDNAAEIVPTLADTGLRYIGFKDVGADLARQRELTSLAHDAGFEVMLEVVSTSKEAELSSLHSAAEAGFDWVLGGTHAEEGAGILPDGVRYCPFPGRVVDHPSVLLGTIDEIAADAERLTGLDHVSGLDLLAYRHPTADPLELIREVVRRSSGPVIVAGSIASIDRAVAVSEAGAWGYTIGSAIFDGLLPGAPSIADQVRRVLELTGEVSVDASREPHT